MLGLMYLQESKGKKKEFKGADLSEDQVWHALMRMTGKRTNKCLPEMLPIDLHCQIQKAQQELYQQAL